MSKKAIKTFLEILSAIITAALTAIGTTSCMGYGPINADFLSYMGF